jgi:hypothetical protein
LARVDFGLHPFPQIGYTTESVKETNTMKKIAFIIALGIGAGPSTIPVFAQAQPEQQTPQQPPQSGSTAGQSGNSSGSDDATKKDKKDDKDKKEQKGDKTNPPAGNSAPTQP